MNIGCLMFTASSIILENWPRVNRMPYEKASIVFLITMRKIRRYS